MKKLFTFLFLGAAWMSFAQESCAVGTTSDISANAENIVTGGEYEYAGAADFDVPIGTILTSNQITFNVLKGSANLQYVNVAFLEESEGLPGHIIQAFDAVIPSSQTFLYDVSESDLDAYQITIDLPSEVVFQKGKYFLQLAAAAGDDNGAWWEITGEDQTYGVFDYGRFGTEDWGGTGYYNKVFQVLGMCADSGEVQPDLGDACHQENAHNAYEVAATFLSPSGIVSVADDFTVAPNTTFYLTNFTMHSILLGGGLHNATINIRSSADGAPGAILHSFVNKGPSEERYNGYWAFPGSPFDVVSVFISFSFEPIQLTEGNYFIEVIPTPYATELLAWESTPLPGIGNYSYSSFDQGATWVEHDGINQVFSVDGFCETSLGVETPQQASGFNYFPNPVKDVLRIDSQKQISTVAIYNIEGREVSGFVFDQHQINMQTLASGVYLVKVQLENGNAEVLRIVKE